jgi:tricorn protease interacting factor F2/3
MSRVTPKNYRIRIEPDLDRFMFSGRSEIEIHADEPIRDITLNALDLAVWNCRVKGGDQFSNCDFSVRPHEEEIKLILPSPMEGVIVVRFDYMGRINDRMAGFYRSQYKAGAETRHIAVTQFEESDARRAFPCFDHPARKATFDVELIIGEDLVAISNGPVAEERILEGGKKSVRFQRTPRMSTYLLFFGVGPFHFAEDPGEVLVRVAALPGMSAYAAYGLDFGRKSLTFCEQYYGIPYPLPKLDLIAIPDFAFGAMENWGAITFRENLLLNHPGITSKAGEGRICEVIAHEMAHQWFGNLVTPSEWKYLWLNESFATYLAYGVVDHYHPEWDMWEQFLQTQTDAALSRDALLETFAIEIPGGEHVVINSSTAPIIYNKGGSVLRQIEGYIGTRDFQRGLKRYLEKHQYGNASSRHLWESFEAVSDKPVSRIMESWIEQPGHPIVDVERKGETLMLAQKRFSYLPGTTDQVWLIPVTVRLFLHGGETRDVSFLLERREGQVEIGPDVAAYKVNHRQGGFFRVRYLEAADLLGLGKRISEKALGPEDRWGLQNDLYALVRSGDLHLNDYLDFLSHYRDEDAFLPLMSIADNLFHAHLIARGEMKARIQLTARTLLEQALSKMGLEPRPGEKHTTAILRDQILFQAALYGSDHAEAFARGQFQGLVAGREVHADIIKAAMEVGAARGGSDVFEWFHQRLNATESEHDRMNILMAMGKFQDERLIEKAQDYALEKVPSRNQFFLIAALASNPHAVPLMWDWYRSRLDQLEQMHPIHYERVISAIVPLCALGREEAVRAFFEGYMAERDMAADVIRLSLEKLEINARMRARLASQ